VGFRRDVPGERLDVHLRARMPRRAYGPSPELVQGCCSYGAHFTGKADIKRVAGRRCHAHGRSVAIPQQSLAQLEARKLRFARTGKEGQLTTRTVEGACIFLNRPGSRAGPGCALHRAALERGKNPLELKPDVWLASFPLQARRTRRRMTGG